MAGIIVCPKCNNQFEPTDAFRDEVQRELNAKAKEWQARKEEEFKKELKIKEDEANLKLETEKKKLADELKSSLQKSIAADYENQLKMLQQTQLENDIKLKQARDKELEFLKKEQALKNKEQELEINLQKQLIAERANLSEQIRKEESEKSSLKETEFQMRMKELEKQLEDQKKLADEMRRKAEQGSMQLQGEVQELMLEDILRSNFPYDKIEPVGKGVRGADCIQTVCNPFAQDCGKIIYESKRTKDFSNEWIEKLKSDMRSTGSDIAVIVTHALPKDMERFGEKDGIYVCTFAEVKSLAAVLRTSILKVFSITKNQEGKGDKMNLLYDYLTSNEFGEQWKAIREGFMSMRMSIQKERDAMERLWKSREKQLEKVLLNAAHIRGSIEGIAGQDVNLNLLEDEDTEETLVLD
jgi:hypothetical protein